MNTSTIVTYGRLAARQTTEADLDWILRTEGADDNAGYIQNWPADKHRSIIADPSCGHWVLETIAGGRSVGYAILIGINNPNKSLLFQRLVIAEKGGGLGRQAMRLMKKYAFEIADFHRLWFDVMDFNERARRLYVSEGFREEGVLREHYLIDGAYVSVVIMAMLRDEYLSRRENQLEK